jgi:hypothetical protein
LSGSIGSTVGAVAAEAEALGAPPPRQPGRALEAGSALAPGRALDPGRLLVVVGGEYIDEGVSA